MTYHDCPRCGEKNGLRFLRPIGMSVFAIDPSLKQIQEARRHHYQMIRPTCLGCLKQVPVILTRD